MSGNPFPGVAYLLHAALAAPSNLLHDERRERKLSPRTL